MNVSSFWNSCMKNNWLVFKGYQEPDEDKTETQSIMLATFVAVICACQVPSESGT